MKRIISNKKIESHALVLTVVVSIVIFTVLSGLFLVDRYDNYFISNYKNLRQATYNLNSGEVILLNSPDNYKEWTQVSISDENKVELLVSQWGVYEIGHVRTIYKTDTFQRSFFIGYHSDESKALRLYSTSFPLRLAGNTRIKGGVEVPLGKVEQAFIAGKPYTGVSIPKSSISESTHGNLRTVDFNIPNDIEPVLLEEDSLKNAFNEITKNVTIQNNLVDLNIEGNVVITSNQIVAVKASSRLENVILKAPTVIIESGFEGSIQVVATDSLVVENDVKLNFPSALVVDSEKNNKPHKIRVGSGTVIQGLVSISDRQKDYENNYMYLNVGSTVFGNVIAQGVLSLRGNVYGYVEAYKTVVSKSSSVNYNTLLDCTIDSDQLEDFCVFFFGNNAGVLKYLE